MNTIKEVDLRFITEFEKAYSTLPLDEYLKYLQDALRPDFRNLKLLIPEFEAILNETTENLIDITLVLAVLEKDTAKKIAFLTNHIIAQLEYRKNVLDGDAYNYLRKEVANLAELSATYLNYHKQHEEDLLKYVEYNTYINQKKPYMKFTDFRAK